MSVFSLCFKPLSVLTKIPDSQTIFGAFCYKYKEIYGNEKLEELLNIERQNPIFLVSSMFFKDVLPFPQDFKPKRREINTLEETINNKKYKKIKYISKNLYIDYKKDKDNFIENYYENIKDKYKIINKNILAYKNENLLEEEYIVEDIRMRNSGSTSDNPDDKQLFKDKILYCNEKLEFNVYVNILNNKYEEEILNTFKSMKYVFLGGMKSIGYNMYNCISYEKENEWLEKQSNMLISKAVVDKDIDYSNSSYTLSIITNKFNVQGEKTNRKQVVVFNEGSIINIKRNYIGKVIEEEQNNSKTYQYYLGMFI